LNALTGKFVWFYQTVHHDLWDRDNMQTPMNLTVTYGGKKVDVISTMNKGGLNYVLDAKTGKPVYPVAEVPVPQEPLSHTYPTQPIPVGGDEIFPQHVLDPESYQGVIAPDGKPYKVGPYLGPYPVYTDKEYVVGTPFGYVNWPQPGYDPSTGAVIQCGNISSTGFEAPPAADQHPVIGQIGFGNGVVQYRTSSPPNSLRMFRLTAYIPQTNKVMWAHDELATGGIQAGKTSNCSSQVTTTAGGLVLIGRVVASPNNPAGVGAIQAFDSKTGNKVWEIPVLVNGQPVAVVPRITTYSVGGKQYIASFTHNTLAGPDISAYALP
jgi:quinoprotein glucose dehydrogenase